MWVYEALLGCDMIDIKDSKTNHIRMYESMRKKWHGQEIQNTDLITRFETSDEMLSQVGDLLTEAPVTNALMLGILEKNKGRKRTEQELYWTVVGIEDTLVMMMSGLYIILYATGDEEALFNAAIHALIDEKISFPGIVGPKDTCDLFKATYEMRSKKSMRIGMNQRIYQTSSSTYQPIDGVTLDLLTDADIPGLVPWMEDFVRIAGEHTTPEGARARLAEKIRDHKLYGLKHQGRIVSMAAKERPFMDMITVSYVYTPVSLRNQGYATTCVGMLTELLLRSYRLVTLYTDLSNPTSNSIYQKIGYRPVIDSVVYLT